MNPILISKRIMALSILTFLGTALLVAVHRMDPHAGAMAQASSIAVFGAAATTLSLAMRSWMWRAGVVVGTIQCIVGLGSVLWLAGALR